jgi:hypothetical protein
MVGACNESKQEKPYRAFLLASLPFGLVLLHFFSKLGRNQFLVR